MVIVGAVTLLFGAIIGCAKDDIKKALAASTMSQIGYMVLAAGLGPAGYAVAILHLLTHGFFKAGLFLGAGSVMHAMSDETDMRRYGELRAVLPITFVTFGLGLPGHHRGAAVRRLLLQGRHHRSRLQRRRASRPAAGRRHPARGGDHRLLHDPSDAADLLRHRALDRQDRRKVPARVPPVMTAPMIVLAIGSVGAGAVLALGHTLASWLEPVVGTYEAHHAVPAWVTTVAALTAVAVGVGIAYRQYANRRVPQTAPQDVSALTVAARRDLYGDAVNEAVFERGGRQVTRALVTVDDVAVEGAVRGLAAAVGRVSDGLRGLQTGFARSYALTMLAGRACSPARS